MFYEQAKQNEEQVAEAEVASAIDHEMSRLDTGLWTTLEKDRKKKAKLENIKKKREKFIIN